MRMPIGAGKTDVHSERKTKVEQKMTTFLPEISASKVAGLIGLHAYQSPHETMYDLLSRHIPTKNRIADLEVRERRIAISKLKDAVLRSSPIRDVVNAGIRACESKTDISETLADVETQAGLVLNLRHSELSSEVRQMLATEVRGAVQKQRGLNKENKILDTYEADNNVKVKDRNTMTFKKTYSTFKLIGRTDGYVEAHNRIVDSKARTRWWKDIPMYDEIQLRVYMALSGAAESELIESFPDGRVRETKFINDIEKWEVIHGAIGDAVKKMTEATVNEEVLRAIVFANTVSV
jgi:hypothetical protein